MLKRKAKTNEERMEEMCHTHAEKTSREDFRRSEGL